MTADAMPTRSGSLIWEPFGDGLVIHDAARAEVHLLNQTSALLWDLCDGRTSIAEVVEALAQRAQHPHAEVDRDVRANLTQLQAAGLVDRPPLPDPVQLPAYEPVAEPLSSPVLRVVDERVVVRSNSEQVLARVDEVFGDLSDDRPTTGGVGEIGIDERPDGEWRVYGRGHDQVVGSSSDLDEVLAALINRVVAPSTAPLCFHAGAVRSPAGQVVGLPGHSGSGKSTLTGAFVRAGWDYLTDEALGIRPGSLQAVGYPKPLSLDDTSCRLLAPSPGPDPMVRARRLRPGTMGLLGDAGALALVVFPTYVPGSEPVVTAVAPDDAVVELAGHAINLTPAGRDGLRTIVAIASSVPCVRLDHDDLDGAVRAIGALLGARPPA